MGPNIRTSEKSMEIEKVSTEEGFDYSKVDVALRRIIENTSPKMIIVFGSVARHEARSDSDLDILVVFDVPEYSSLLFREVKKQFIGLKLPSDVVVMTLKDFNHYAKDVQSFTHEIITTGEVVYAQ